jgi:CrcB protein
VTWVAVGVVGAVGALLRFHVDGFVQRRTALDLPLGTLVVNLSGSFCLGLLDGLSVTGDTLLVVGTGLIGSYTTFSTWMLESHRLAEEGEGRVAAANLVLSLAGGILAALAGWGIGSLL